MNQVVEKGDTLTAVAAEAYAPELSEQGISPEGQQQIVAEAVTAQTATPEGLQALGLKDADLIKPGDVIPIGEMAEEVDVVTHDYLSQEDDALQDDNEMAEAARLLLKSRLLIFAPFRTASGGSGSRFPNILQSLRFG